MTANELIDNAKNISTTIEALEWVQKAVPMLGQQQTEIETLKEKAEHWEEKYRDAIADLSIENYWRMGNDSK